MGAAWLLRGDAIRAPPAPTSADDTVGAVRPSLDDVPATIMWALLQDDFRPLLALAEAKARAGITADICRWTITRHRKPAPTDSLHFRRIPYVKGAAAEEPFTCVHDVDIVVPAATARGVLSGNSPHTGFYYPVRLCNVDDTPSTQIPLPQSPTLDSSSGAAADSVRTPSTAAQSPCDAVSVPVDGAMIGVWPLLHLAVARGAERVVVFLLSLPEGAADGSTRAALRCVMLPASQTPATLAMNMAITLCPTPEHQTEDGEALPPVSAAFERAVRIMIAVLEAEPSAADVRRRGQVCVFCSLAAAGATPVFRALLQQQLKNGHKIDCSGCLSCQEGTPPLVRAIRKVHIPFIRLLLQPEFGVDVNTRTSTGWPCLVLAALSNAALCMDRSGGHIDLSLLLEAGADPNATSVSGVSALHIAALAGSLPDIQALLAAGADPGTPWTFTFSRGNSTNVWREYVAGSTTQWNLTSSSIEDWGCHSFAPLRGIIITYFRNMVPMVFPAPATLAELEVAVDGGAPDLVRIAHLLRRQIESTEYRAEPGVVPAVAVRDELTGKQVCLDAPLWPSFILGRASQNHVQLWHAYRDMCNPSWVPPPGWKIPQTLEYQLYPLDLACVGFHAQITEPKTPLPLPNSVSFLTLQALSLHEQCIRRTIASEVSAPINTAPGEASVCAHISPGSIRSRTSTVTVARSVSVSGYSGMLQGMLGSSAMEALLCIIALTRVHPRPLVTPNALVPLWTARVLEMDPYPHHNALRAGWDAKVASTAYASRNGATHPNPASPHSFVNEYLHSISERAATGGDPVQAQPLPLPHAHAVLLTYPVLGEYVRARAGGLPAWHRRLAAVQRWVWYQHLKDTC